MVELNVDFGLFFVKKIYLSDQFVDLLELRIIGKRKFRNYSS